MRVETKNKKPIDFYWTSTSLEDALVQWEEDKKQGKDRPKPTRVPNYKWDEPAFQEYISNGGNYGVATGRGGLVVLDADTEDFRKAIEERLPKTFTVETGSGGRHYYLQSDQTKKIVFKVGETHYGELQGLGQQVIGAGSVHPNGRMYQVLIDVDIVFIPYSDIKTKLFEFLNQKDRELPQVVKTSELSDQLQITDVVDMSGLRKDGDEYVGAHPIHGSTTGQNFRVNPKKNVWHCFRENKGGDTLMYIGMKERIIDCGEKLDGENFKNVLKIAQEKYGLKLPEAQKPLSADEYATYKRELIKRVATKLEGKTMRDMMKRIDEATSKSKWKNMLDALEICGLQVADVKTRIFPQGEDEVSNIAKSLMDEVEEVIGIKPRNEGDPYNYRIKLREKVLILSSKDLLMPMEFRRRWLEEHKEALVEINNDDWLKVVNSWMSVLKEEDAPVSVEETVLEWMLYKLLENKVTNDRDLAKTNEEYFFVEHDITNLTDGEDYNLLYFNHHLFALLTSQNMKTTVEKMYALLKPYLAEKCRNIRVNGIQTRFWVFRKDFVEVDWRSRFYKKREE